MGVVPINVGIRFADEMVQMVLLVELRGNGSLWTYEHVLTPIDYESKYPDNKFGNMGAAHQTKFVDALIALSAVAASTETIRLATGVLIFSLK